MCSIPGLPTAGTKVATVITKVDVNSACGLVELWVNLNAEQKQSYNEMKNEIQDPERRFSGCEGKPEDLCLVCISDTWHRARIVSNECDAYEVFLIDQGQSHNATSKALAWAKSDSFVLPPEVESCILANVLSIEYQWSEKANKFLVSLPGKKFTGLVQDVLMPDRIFLLDIPVVSLHMSTLGVTKQIPAEDFKCVALKFLSLLKGETPEDLTGPTQEDNSRKKLHKQNQYFYPELLTGTYVTVEVTDVTNELNIVCKLVIFSKAVDILSDQLQQYYEENREFEADQPRTCGELCAAKGTDGKWYRSLLKQNIPTDGDTVDVFHVDEGKTESVPVVDVKPLLGQFLRMPVVTYLCSLAGIEGNGRDWTADERNYLKSLLLNHPMVARFDHHGKQPDLYDATLFAANAVCINTCFLERIGLIPLSMPAQDQRLLSSFIGFLKDQQDADLGNKVLENGDAINGPNSDLKATSLAPENRSTYQDTVVTVGSQLSVKVSYIESSEKFWCQKAERKDDLIRLTRDLQKHYNSIKPQPLTESICVARNPSDNMWHRAKIVSKMHSSVVDVVFIDYGRKCKVPLRDVCAIDPAFLQLNAQAFKCRLFSPSRASELSAAEFRKFSDACATAEASFQCAVKAVTNDEEGRPLNVVDIKTPSGDNFLAWKRSQSETEIPSPVQSKRYNISPNDIKIGVKEKMWVTSSETVSHFYCQLHRYSDLYDEVMKDISRHFNPKLCSDRPPGLGSICLAKYTNKMWYRAQVVDIHPKVKVHFVDYGDTLAVNDHDICAFPSEASVARSVPALAIHLGLSGIPANVPLKVNQWFSDLTVGEEFTISVVAIEENGKVIVELFEGSLHVNQTIRQKISQTRQHKESRWSHRADQQLPDRSEWTPRPRKDFYQQNDTKWTNHNGVRQSEETSASNCVQMMSESTSRVSAPQTGAPTWEVIPEDKENVSGKSQQSFHGEMKQPSPSSCTDGNVNIFKRPKVIPKSTVEAYSTCIVGPHFFWCQLVNSEELLRVTEIAQAAGKERKDASLETLQPGYPCLALFSDDNQWYRAQVVRTTDALLHVVFVDFGNESDVDIKDVTSLPLSLLQIAPQAFLCSLDGFDESSGSWDDSVYDDFYNVLVDKPLKVTVVSSGHHSEMEVPQHAVKIQCDDVDIGGLMEKHWKCGKISEEPSGKMTDQTSVQEVPNQSKATDSSEGIRSRLFKEPEISKSKTAMVYASCISEPFFFWCQDTNSDALNRLSQLVQEAGQSKQDVFPETLGPGSPCLALFANDNLWYRAQITKRVDDVFHVVFIDYGNESEVDVNNVRPLPESLLDVAPQAILCRLNGFASSEGSWADEVYEDFYAVLVDKPLRLTVSSEERHSEITVPQYSVDIECDGVNVNSLMKKYWKVDTDELLAKSMESVNLNDTVTPEEEQDAVSNRPLSS